MDQKIGEQHLARKAILYVRQSSAHQVARNGESRKLQYGMESRLRELGWAEVEVVDEDLGKSASGSVDRSGFERMVAEVCLGQVGAVAAREVSRFARNSRDWQQLIEVCRMVDTVLVDHESVYCPRRGNDRLLLGLKGSLNEYELDILRLRSYEARRAKARRGELVVATPVGFVKGEGAELAKDPDRRIQKALHLVFDKFVELGSVRQVLLWFLEQHLDLPARRYGAAGWEIHWRRPTYGMMLGFLKNPIYGGIYSYGRTGMQIEYRDGVPRKRMRSKPLEEWIACIYDHHEGYIDRDLFDRIQQMIASNSKQGRQSGKGAVRKGPALLAGLLRCRRCGRKLSVTYTGRERNAVRYACVRGQLDNGEPKCISFGGVPVDEAVSREVLRVVAPGGIEAAKKALEEGVRRRGEVGSALKLAVQEARYSVERARRQYDAVDPENRLVADELERRWNRELEKLDQLERRVEEDAAVQDKGQPSTLHALDDLAHDLMSVWNCSTTDVRLKKRITRTLVEEVVVDVDGPAGLVHVAIHWKGGVHTEIEVQRRRRGQNGLHTSAEVVEAVAILSRICTDETIAGYLNRNGLLTGRGNRWTQERVQSLRTKRELPRHSKDSQERDGWMNLKQASAYVGLAGVSLKRAVERGEVVAEHPLPDGPWVFRRDHLDEPCVRHALSRIQKRSCRTGVQGPGQLSLFKSTS